MLGLFLDDAEDTGGRLASLLAAGYRCPEDPAFGVIYSDSLVAQRNDGDDRLNRLARDARLDGRSSAFVPTLCRARMIARRDHRGQAGNRSLEPNWKASFATNSRVAVVTKKHTPFPTNKHTAETNNASYGLASFYAHESQTASGEKFDAHELTAAHRTLPFGTRVRVTSVSSGRSVTVRVNDRGPFVPGRVIDVTSSAAETLGITGQGIAKVKLDVLE